MKAKYTVKQIATADEAYHQEPGDFYLVFKKELKAQFAEKELAEKVANLLNSD